MVGSAALLKTCFEEYLFNGPQTGSPFKMYQQAEMVAEARMTAFINSSKEQHDPKLPAGAGTSLQG